MKQNKQIFCLAATIVLSGLLRGAENPNVGSQFGPSSTVPSANQGRRMVTPFDPTVGNNIVTGNVSGMKHFRGVVPYGSSYYSGVGGNDSGSRSVDAFLRRSADPIQSDRNPGQARPYYQQERVSTRFVRPETLGPAPAGPTTSGRVTNPYVLSNSPVMSGSQYRQRPLSNDSRQIEELLTRQNLLQQENLPNTELQLTREDKRKEKPEIVPPSLRQEPLLNQPVIEEPVERKLRPEEEVAAEFLKENQKAIEEQKSMRSERKPFELDEQTGENAASQEAGDAPEGQEESILGDAKKQAQTAALGKEVIGAYKSYDRLAQARYTAYMQNAEQFIKQGKFYKAADLYELAAIWKPDGARSYLGKGFSLFAAGEYMSSSYYIGRAIELEPALAGKSFKLDKLIGDRDVFENRMLEMSQWQEKSGSGELAFLIAYVLYHDGKPSEASAALDKAEKTMPDSPSVQTLKTIITPSAAERQP